MTLPTKVSELSNSQRKLIPTMQHVNYGSISNIAVADGELNFDLPVDVLVDIRLDEDVRKREEIALGDFGLCTEVRRLLIQIDLLKNGTIERIVVHCGLPRRIIVRSTLSQNAIEGIRG